MRRAQRYLRTQKQNARRYTCEECGGEFVAGWSEEEAIAEKEKHFGDFPLEHCAQVCDDCYQNIMAEISELDPGFFLARSLQKGNLN